MYQKYFSFSELPFEGTPDKNFYYVGANQHQSLDVLKDSLSRSGVICVLTGPSGTGKTTLVRMLIKSLPRRMRIIAIDDPRLSSEELLCTILLSCNIAASRNEGIANLTYKLRNMLESSMEMGIVTTVIIDEAQGLSDAVIEQIRLIYNIEGDFGKMLNFLLVGQEDLLEIIKQDCHKMFLNRIKSFCAIPAMQKNEVQAYINFRTMQAGCHHPLFTDRAITLLHHKSQGLPRTINIIADRALAISCDRQKNMVDSFILRKAAAQSLNESTFVQDIFRAIKSSLTGLEFYSKLSVITFALCVSFAIFAASLFFGDKIYKDELYDRRIDVALNYDKSVADAYQNYIDNVISGKNSKNRNLYQFNLDVWQSLFLNRATDTLIRLAGYQKSDKSLSSCADIESIDLKCTEHNGSLDKLLEHKSKAVISLLDENLMPFYAVLMYADESKAQILLDRHIWTVRRQYLDKVYNGSYIYLQPLALIDLFENFRQKTQSSTESAQTKGFRSEFKGFEELLELDYDKALLPYAKMAVKSMAFNRFVSLYKRVFVTRSEKLYKDFVRDYRHIKEEDREEAFFAYLSLYVKENVLDRLESQSTDAMSRALIIYYADNYNKDINALTQSLFLREHKSLISKEVVYAD